LLPIANAGRRVLLSAASAALVLTLASGAGAAGGGLNADELAAFADYTKQKRAAAVSKRRGAAKPEFVILGDPRIVLQPPSRQAAPPTPYRPLALPNPRPQPQPPAPASQPARSANASATVAHARSIDNLIRRVGIDPARVLVNPGAAGRGQGGPYVPLNRSQVALLRGGQSAVVGGLVSRPDRLLALVRKLPLTEPVKDATPSSSFGARRDPFTEGWAFHSGIDMPGPVNSAVLSTAPGVVTFAGWHDSYGRLVEIEHDFGISTRYAHLNTIAVRRGQRVQTRQRVGGLGTTGRSTGPHLHYEVLVDGRQVDPQPFLDTGRDIHGG
jgi:murein DD-endopeptidase MepM/ murein hydrolase activator NlpD